MLWIALSHLTTQIRWLVSAISICSSLVFPLVFKDIPLRAATHWGSSGILMLPTPLINSVEIAGHVYSPCSQRSLAFTHRRCRAIELHSSMMCGIDSMVWQRSAQNSLSSNRRALDHFSPNMYTLWIVLNRNCYTLGLKAWCLISVQILASAMSCPLRIFIASFISCRFS